MKKLIAILLAMTLLLSFTACNDDDVDDGDSNIFVDENGDIHFPIEDIK